MSKEHKAYPSWRYAAHKTEAGKTVSKLVQSEEEDNALGEGWFHSPSLKDDADGAGVDAPRDEAEKAAAGPAPVEYVHVHFPKHVYFLDDGGNVKSKLVHDVEAFDAAVADGCTESPAELAEDYVPPTGTEDKAKAKGKGKGKKSTKQ